MRPIGNRFVEPLEGRSRVTQARVNERHAVRRDVLAVRELVEMAVGDSPAVHNETSALLTFFTDVKTTGVTANGPLTIIIREGTTTFYRNSAPASFSSPDSFQSGEPVMTSTIRQQVIVDAVEKTFTVVNVNTLTETRFFELGDGAVRIGSRGDMIRTSLMGVLKVRDGSAPPPTGYFAGSGVGVSRHRD